MMTNSNPVRLTATPWVLLAALTTSVAPALAFQQPSAPATTTAATTTSPAATPGEGESVVIVTNVEGKARARTGPDAPYQAVAEGMRLPVGAEINTGPRARVKCLIPPGEEFVVDRMSTVTVMEAERRGNRQQTRLVMEYGRAAARVQAAGIEHDMQIRTPATTASVRGTNYTVYDQPPFAPELRTYSGLVDYRFAKRQLLVGKGGTSRGGRGSAETALLASVVDPSIANARTNAEAARVANEVSRGAVLSYNPNIQLTEIRGGAGPQTDQQLLNSLPGRLNFVLRWNQNVDVDLFVTVQPGDQLQTILTGTFNPQTFLYPGFGMQTAPSGGRVPYNHRGGPSGGQEVCFWPDNFPNAVYGFSALSNSPDQSAAVRFNAYLDGQKISLYTFGDDGSLIRTKGIQRTLEPEGVFSSIVLAPTNPLFEELLPESPDETVGADQGQGGTPAGSVARSPQTAKERAKVARAEKVAARAAARAAAAKAKQAPKSANGTRGVATPRPAGR